MEAANGPEVVTPAGLVGVECDQVADVGEGDQAPQFMKTVGALSEDIQRQVDFGGGEFLYGRHVLPQKI